MTLRIGTLFSGIETPIQAVKKMGIRFRHVFACESDRKCRQVISSRFSPEQLYSDINTMPFLPDSCDLVVAGFPCQAFSACGFQKGFEDDRGAIFFKATEYLKKTQPKCFVFENVKNLLAHGDKATFLRVTESINESGYDFDSMLLDSSVHTGIPQQRRRVYLVGYRKGDPDFIRDASGRWTGWPQPVRIRKTLAQILGGTVEFQLIRRKKNTSIEIGHDKVRPKNIGFTLRVGGHRSAFGDRHAWDCYLVNGQWHRLTVREACQLQGMNPDFYDTIESKTGLTLCEGVKFAQIGNAMTVAAVGAVISGLVFNGKSILEEFKKAA